jgi:DNA mismatch endonuclease (patch repair protein)
MAKIKSTGCKSTEVSLARLFGQTQLTGWRRGSLLAGRPDFVFRALRLAIFVDGCFWHGCPRCYRRPSSRRAYWDAKVARNKLRDKTVNRILRQEGWRVVRVWEHELKETVRLTARLRAHVRQPGLAVKVLRRAARAVVNAQGKARKSSAPRPRAVTGVIKSGWC